MTAFTRPLKDRRRPTIVDEPTPSDAEQLAVAGDEHTPEAPDDALDDDAWLSEIRRRAERVQRGESQSVTWEEAKRSALDRLRRQ